MLNQVIHRILNNHGLLLMMVITAVNAGNYLLNLVLGRILGPESFSEAGILATLVMVLSFIAVGIQVTAAKYTAELTTSNSETKMREFHSWIEKQSFISSILITLLLIICIPIIKGFLQFESGWPLFLIFVGIPIYFNLSVRRGFLQGMQSFRQFSLTYVAEMVGRLLITIPGILIINALGLDLYSEVVSLGFLASFIGAILFSGKFKYKPTKTINLPKKAVITFFMIMMCYEGTQIAISYSDVILVKHYFEDQQAGLYAALSLLGRIVYFGTWALVMVLVPKVIQKAKQGLPTTQTLIHSLIIIISFGGVMVITTALIPGFIVGNLLGDEFLPLGDYLWKYALATTLFAAANVIAYYYLSLGKYIPVILSAFAGISQVVLIMINHQTILNIINIQLILMSCLLLGMITYHLINPTQYENRISYTLSPK